MAKLKEKIQEFAEIEFNPTWNEKTIQRAYEEAEGINRLLPGWVDAVDNKVIAVFGVTALITGLVPTFAGIKGAGLLELGAWVAGLIFWAGASVCCILAFRPRAFRVDPEPKKLIDKWLDQPPERYSFFRLRDMAKTYTQNEGVLRQKSRLLTGALVFLALEILSLGIAILAGA